jgi:hypothetical protein
LEFIVRANNFYFLAAFSESNTKLSSANGYEWRSLLGVKKERGNTLIVDSCM